MRLNLFYDETADWQTDLNHIEYRQYVARTMVPPGYEDYFQQKARYISANTSVRIEGHDNDDETAIRIMVEGPDEEIPDEVAAANVNEANDLISQLSADDSLQIDAGLIRTLNSMVLRHLDTAGADRRGLYRSSPAAIVDSITREVRYRPPPPTWVSRLMDGLVVSIREWRDRKLPGPLVAGLAHFALISIHPFEDGNGRTARLIADLLLEQSGWTASGMISMSQAIDRHRESYYDALRETQGLDFKSELDATAFLRFHVNSLVHASQALEDHAVIFNKRLREWKKIAGSLELNDRQATGFMYLVDLGVPLSSSRYAELSNASQSSAIADLNDLVKRNYVERIGSGKLTRYQVAPLIQQRMTAAEQTVTTVDAV
jgi:Fic family protein